MTLRAALGLCLGLVWCSCTKEPPVLGDDGGNDSANTGGNRDGGDDGDDGDGGSDRGESSDRDGWDAGTESGERPMENAGDDTFLDSGPSEPGDTRDGPGGSDTPSFDTGGSSDPSPSSPGMMETDESGRIVDIDGALFIANGVNIFSHGTAVSMGGMAGAVERWTDDELREWLTDLHDNKGVNALRLNREDWSIDYYVSGLSGSFYTDAEFLDEVIRTALLGETLGMKILLGYRDANQNESFAGDETKRTELLDDDELDQAVTFFSGLGQVLSDNGLSNVLVELNNEIGSTDYGQQPAEAAEWLADYLACLTALRQGGFRGIVVINDSNSGQGSTVNGSGNMWSGSHLISGAKNDESGETECYMDQLVAADVELLGDEGGSNGRLAVDLHPYFGYSDEHLETVSRWFLNRKIPVLYGEFSNSPDINPGHDMGFLRPLRVANTLGLGLYFWAYNEPIEGELAELFQEYQEGSRAGYRDKMAP